MEGSYSVSQSKEHAEPEVYNTANAMEEYLRQQEAKQSQHKPKASAKSVSKELSESSDKYTDEDFESMSKSQSQGLPRVQPAGKVPSTFSKQYIKKENKFV